MQSRENGDASRSRGTRRKNRSCRCGHRSGPNDLSDHRARRIHAMQTVRNERCFSVRGGLPLRCGLRNRVESHYFINGPESGCPSIAEWTPGLRKSLRTLATRTARSPAAQTAIRHIHKTPRVRKIRIPLRSYTRNNQLTAASRPSPPTSSPPPDRHPPYTASTFPHSLVTSQTSCPRATPLATGSSTSAQTTACT